MKAFVVHSPGQSSIEEVDAPIAKPGHVVIDIARAGVCGTDVEFFDGDMAYFQTGEAQYPIRLGHEWCGTVSKVGDGVDKKWIGKRVTGDTMLGCQKCKRCRSGLQHVCADRFEIGIRNGWPGALAEQLLVPEFALHELPDSIDDTVGALIEPGGNSLRSAQAAHAGPGKKVLVWGSGTIGLLTAQFAIAMGAEVHMVGRNSATLSLAKDLGVHFSTQEFEEVDGGFDAIIDATNSAVIPAEALAAIGGSTNAVVHLLAIAGRLGVNLTLDDFDRIGSRIPLLVNLQPSGKFLMEDFHRAGGLSAVFKQLEKLMNPKAITVTGKSITSTIGDGEIYDAEVIKSMDAPLQKEAGIAVLRGNIAPLGAVIKPAAASPKLLKHSGPALVFESIEDFHARIDSDDLDVTADSVLVLRGCGPKGYPGMPEVANMKIPGKLVAHGVTDMVRICDGRMSGTAYGTVILHVAPESAAGGPLSKIRSGDIIELDVAARTINVKLSEADLAARSVSTATENAYADPIRGWQRMYIDHVMQADTGADLDFLIGSSGSDVTRESH